MSGVLVPNLHHGFPKVCRKRWKTTSADLTTSGSTAVGVTTSATSAYYLQTPDEDQLPF
jgi:hypothetical protein